MGAVGDVSDRQDRPAHVRFERVAIEDKASSLALGRYAAKDVDFALITPPYSRDVVRQKVSQWLVNLEQDVRNNRLPAQWAEQYREAYKLFLKGQEQPLNGTPIKGWGVISPAQQEVLIHMNVFTVEDLAGINDEGLRRIGMGGMELKNKAIAWNRQLNDRGPLVQENAALKAQIDLLMANQATLTRQLQELKAQQPQVVNQPALVTRDEQITADDILPEPEKHNAIKRK